jgi:hypothetical protein
MHYFAKGLCTTIWWFDNGPDVPIARFTSSRGSFSFELTTTETVFVSRLTGIWWCSAPPRFWQTLFHALLVEIRFAALSALIDVGESAFSGSPCSACGGTALRLQVVIVRHF